MLVTFQMIGPVKSAAAIVSRILQYPGTTVESSVNVVRMGKVNAKNYLQIDLYTPQIVSRCYWGSPSRFQV